MSQLKCLAITLVLLSGGATAAEFKDPYCPFVFVPSSAWEQSKSGYFSLSAADGAELTGMPIPDSAHNEPLDEVRQKAAYFHSMSFGGTDSAAVEQVSGPGWSGFLQQQTTALGPEMQFVARSEHGTCLYYLRIPADATPFRLLELRQLILSAQAVAAQKR